MAKNTVRVNVIGDASQLQQAFGQGATAGEKFKARMELVAKAVVAALAIKALAAVKDFVSDSVRAFSDLNESLNALEVTYGDAAEGIKKLGQESAQSLGLSNAEFNSFAVQISAFAHQIAGDGGDIVGVVDELATRVTDFASVMNLDVAEAATKFQSGLAGESEPLRKFGIDVSAAKVEMVALAEGIWDGNGAMTEGEKVQARYEAIMQQTEKTAGDFANTVDDYANAQRVANAEMENAKARVGEVLVPFAQLTEQLKLLGAQTLGILSTAVMELTGQLSSAEGAAREFEIQTGASADTAEAALTIMKQYGESAEDLIPFLGLTREELERLRDADEDWLRSMGFTEEQIEDLASAVSRELASAMTEGEEKARALQRAQADLGDETGDTTEEIKTQADTLRAQTDPLFAAMQHADDLAEAQRALNDAVVQYGEDSDEAHDAARDVASANADLIGVLEQLKEDGIDPTGEAARGMLEGMGIPPGVVTSLFAEFDRIERNFEDRVFKLTVSAPGIEYQQRANRITPHNTGETALHSGGIVSEGFLDGNRSSRQEAVIPLDTQEGKQALAAAFAKAMGGAGINITVHAGLGTNGHDVGEQIVEEIIRARRRGIAV